MALPQRSLRTAARNGFSRLPALVQRTGAPSAPRPFTTSLPTTTRFALRSSSQQQPPPQRRAFTKDARPAPASDPSTPTPAAATKAPPKTRGSSKLYASADAAVADIKSGSTILSAGFGVCGIAQTLIRALARRGPQSLHSLTAVSNNAGAGDHGLALLAQTGQLGRLVLSYLGANKQLERAYLTGKIAVELTPQGTIAERLRAAGAGIPAFYTATGVGTLVETGGIAVRLGGGEGGKEVLEAGRGKEVREFGGRRYVLEEALYGDVAILRAARVDTAGNCQFRLATRTFAPLMAKAAGCAIVEAEEVVAEGEIEPDMVHLPGIYVDRIVPATEGKAIEVRKVRGGKEGEGKLDPRRERIARRTARELKEGFYVNLGVGIPTLAVSFLDPQVKVWIQSENGLLGMGPYPTEDEVDPDLINAGKETVTLIPGASTFDSAESFGMIRGGHVDVSVLGALQVSASGDLANYMIPGKTFKGMGGAIDLVSNPDVTKIIVATEHVAKDGSSKIVQECNLPLTGAKVVSTIITDMCVFQVDRVNGGLTLTEVAPGVTVEDVQSKTDAKFKVAEDLRTME
ncbi:coenzyme a [Diplodia corticola]|uniref:Succinyl-CoA:3-ketoacid-coenzyme A transferase n=1 Tax=Diplodia corticola TaxID=236234 RepID=A0A1J9RM64_9PEZI|nr:coenzyme a [Diplodia corticola]OJD33667.1 coenzyme a [Diplodia corticola]